MIKSEQILSDLVLSKLPKDSMLKALMSPHVTKDILLAMEEIAKQAFEAGEKNGAEEALFCQSIIEQHECTAPDFNEWYNKHLS